MAIEPAGVRTSVRWDHPHSLLFMNYQCSIATRNNRGEEGGDLIRFDTHSLSRDLPSGSGLPMRRLRQVKPYIEDTRRGLAS